MRLAWRVAMCRGLHTAHQAAVEQVFTWAVCCVVLRVALPYATRSVGLIPRLRLALLGALRGVLCKALAQDIRLSVMGLFIQTDFRIVLLQCHIATCNAGMGLTPSICLRHPHRRCTTQRSTWSV